MYLTDVLVPSFPTQSTLRSRCALLQAFCDTAIWQLAIGEQTIDPFAITSKERCDLVHVQQVAVLRTARF
jgi:hypothetical protein